MYCTHIMTDFLVCTLRSILKDHDLFSVNTDFNPFPDKITALLFLLLHSKKSEESGDDEKNHVKPLHWRSPLIKDFFLDLDQEFHANKSAQAKRQTKVREVATVVSSRPVPTNMPSWAID